MIEEDAKWYVARTRNAQALHVRTLLQEYHVEYFIPTIQKIVERNEHRMVKEVPLIPNLVFIHTTKTEACALANERKIPIFYVIDRNTHTLMIVPDKQMNQFIQVVDLSPESVCLSDMPFVKGTKVRVIKGEFTGIEGEMLGMATRTYVILRIGDMMAAKIKVPKSNIVQIV